MNKSRSGFIIKSLLDDSTNSFLSPEQGKEQAYQVWKQHLLEVFSTRLNKRKLYIRKVEFFLKSFFLEFYENLPQTEQLLFLDLSFYNNNPKKVHDLFASYVQQLDQTTGGRPDLDNTRYRVLHHIQPRFEGGTDEIENRVLLHQHQHALIHLFRYSWKKISTDLNAFSSACLTNDQLKRRQSRVPTQSTIEARKKTTQNKEWQATFGAKGRMNRTKPPTVTALLRRSGSEAGNQYQWINARSRANIFSWFLCTLILGFQNIINTKVVYISPDSDPEKHTVTHIAKQLFSHPVHIETEGVDVPNSRLSNFSQIFRGERQSMWNWRFYCIQIEDIAFILTNTNLRNLRCFFADVFFCVSKSDVVNIPVLKFNLKNSYSFEFTKNNVDDEMDYEIVFEYLFESAKQFTEMYKSFFPEAVSSLSKNNVLSELFQYSNGVNDQNNDNA